MSNKYSGNSLGARIRNFLSSYPEKFPWWITPNEVPKQARPYVSPDMKGYRFPAPGNPAKAPALPGHSQSVYDNNFANYGIDTHRRADTTPYFMTKSNMKLLDANKHNMPDQDLPNYAGSPGRKNADVNRYDPTGLRSSMTASWAELEKKYDENMPDHLPLPHWYLDQAAIVEKYTSRGLPPVPGEEWKPKNETVDPSTGIPMRHANLW